VRNSLADDPTLVGDGLFKLGGIIKDATYNNLSEYLGGEPEYGLTCEGFVDEGEAQVKALVEKVYGKDARIERVYFEERTTREQSSGLANWFDRTNDDNHVLWRVTPPGGKPKGVEIWNALRGKQDVVEDWSKIEQYWKDHFGSDYCPPTARPVK